MSFYDSLGGKLDSEAEEIKDLFAHYGRAVYAASCLETGLVIALMQVELMAQTYGRAKRERKVPARAEWEGHFDAYMDRQHSLTLGTLIARFRSVWRVEASLNALLAQALTCRNFLTHAFFRDRAVEFAHSSGRLSMVKELDAAHDLFSRTDDAVQVSAHAVLAKIGIDPEVHRAQITEIMRRTLDEATKRRSLEVKPRQKQTSTCSRLQTPS